MTKPSLMLVHDQSAPAFDPAALCDSDGEPRILDLDLARRLGFTEDRAIRKIIARNLTELRAHGQVRDAVSQTSPAGGRPGKEYWLNEGQALVLCALSRTPQAARVRKALIACFLAYRQGRLQPETASSVALDRLTQQVAEMSRQIARLAGAAEPVAIPAKPRPSKPAPPAPNPLAFMAAMADQAPPAPEWGDGWASTADRLDLLQGAAAIAAFLNVTPRRVHHLKDTAGLPSFRIGGRVCSTRTALRAWIEASLAGKVVC